MCGSAQWRWKKKLNLPKENNWRGLMHNKCTNRGEFLSIDTACFPFGHKSANKINKICNTTHPWMCIFLLSSFFFFYFEHNCFFLCVCFNAVVTSIKQLNLSCVSRTIPYVLMSCTTWSPNGFSFFNGYSYPSIVECFEFVLFRWVIRNRKKKRTKSLLNWHQWRAMHAWTRKKTVIYLFK